MRGSGAAGRLAAAAAGGRRAPRRRQLLGGWGWRARLREQGKRGPAGVTQPPLPATPALSSFPPRRKLRYFQRYIGPGGLPHIHLYGVYAPTLMDGDKEFYSALLAACEARQPWAAQHTSASSGGTEAGCLDNGGGIAGSPPPAAVREALAVAAARLERFSPEERQRLLHGADTHAAAEALLGMRIFLGGVSHGQYHAWAAATGHTIDSLASSSSIDL